MNQQYQVDQEADLSFGPFDGIYPGFWTSDLDFDLDFSTALNTTDVALADTGFPNMSQFPDYAYISPTPLESICTPLSQGDNQNTSTIQNVYPQMAPPAFPRHSLPRRRSKYALRRSNHGTRPIAIPVIPLADDRPGQSLAIQRWRNSPPEDEAASLSAIFQAMERDPMNQSPYDSHRQTPEAFRSYRTPSSTTSLESGTSGSSMRSNHSSHSATSRKRRTRVTKTSGTPKGRRADPNKADRIFKCTFCCDAFKHKYDWARHEKTLHLNMEEWICAPYGGAVVIPLTGRVHCAYCSALDPTRDHLDQHQHNSCQGGQSTPRSFRRKDHLVQHLRLVHKLETLPLIDDWKVASIPIVSRCGFCDIRMNSWDERTDHLAAHFRKGKTMKDWRGEHEFDEAVASQVTYSFPPYLIGQQSETVVPFSATSHDSLEHTKQALEQLELELAEKGAMEPDSTLGDGPLLSLLASDGSGNKNIAQTKLWTDALSRHLSRFAREQMLKGIMPTDEMFQRESRRVLYHDEDDEWNQTVADDPDWIADFRQRSGFN